MKFFSAPSRTASSHVRLARLGLAGSSVAVAVLVTVVLGGLLAVPPPAANAVPNPVAFDEPTYQALGRVFPDPQGCEAFGVPDDGDADTIKDTPVGISPFAKGRVCTEQFLTYSEVILGSRFLEKKLPRFLEVIRLDQAYDNSNYMSAGLPRNIAIEDGKVRVLARDRRPLYLMKVTDAESPVPERERLHFAYGLSIHGIERAGLEGGIRAMEDLATWAACEAQVGNEVSAFTGVLPPPACAVEGPFTPPVGKPIVETSTNKPVPTAREALQKSVVYFMLANPDGWGRGEMSPAEIEDNNVNLNYTGGAYFQRYNGNGVDMNRDWPTVGYTYKPYSPASEPEVKAFTQVLKGIANSTANGNFAGGIDLHGQLTANAFSFTLLGAGQRDYRKNFSTVDQASRAWADQSARLAWSPYIAKPGTIPGPDPTNPNRPTGVFQVADQWGTVIDTIGYQVTGGMGDWFDSPMGLNAVGIDNEMSLSHVAPNSAYEPILEQMHIDGNKGLIYSQIASMVTEKEFNYDPPGKIGYVFNPKRIESAGDPRPVNPGLPAQNDIDVVIPCESANEPTPTSCGDGTFKLDESNQPTLEFDVKGPGQGVFNGGITVEATWPNATGASANATLIRLQLQQLDEDHAGDWDTAAEAFVQCLLVCSPDGYLQAGQIVTVNDPKPDKWRVRLAGVVNGTGAVGLPARLKIDFHPVTSESSPGQAAFSASSMDFFDDLNQYVKDPAKKLQAIPVSQVINDPRSLRRLDSLVVVNRLGSAAFLETDVGLSPSQRATYFANLKSFADRGGNLVLTDEALRTVAEVGLVAPSKIGSNQPIASGGAPAPQYDFAFTVDGRSNLCTPNSNAPDHSTDPLLKKVCLPGTAGGSLRVAVEPVPIGYAADIDLDGDPSVRPRAWFVERTAWETGCGKSDRLKCTSALLRDASATGDRGSAGFGERHLGTGVVRIAGAMFPDPRFETLEEARQKNHDMRFGVASYSLTFSAWQMFLNLLDYQRPIPQTDLSVTLADSPDPARVGENLTYTLDAKNAGPAGASEIVVRQELPASGVSFVSASEGCSEANGTVACSLEELAKDASKQFQVVVKAEEPGVVTSTLSIAGSEFENDPVPTNNEASATTELFVPKADLALTLSDGPDPVHIGKNVTYSIGVSNSGPDSATDVVVTQQLPAESASFVSASEGCSESSGTVSCPIGNLEVGGTKQIEVVIRADAVGTLNSSASIAGGQLDPNSGNDARIAVTSVELPKADLSVSLIDPPDPVIVGENVTYTLVAGNGGPEDATDVRVTQTLPSSGVTFVSASEGCSEAEGTVTCSLGNLAAGQAVQFEVVVKATEAGTLSSDAAIAGSELQADPDASNNVAVAVTAVQVPQTDLSASLSAAPEPVIVGDNLTYTLAASNAGPQDATDVKVTQQLPAGVTFVSASEGCSQAAGTVTCSIGDLASGGTAQREIVVTADGPASVTSNASVAGGTSENDPNLANNSATAVSSLVCTITGGRGNNTITGTGARDVICGLGGNDKIDGKGGPDLILAGEGADVVQGGPGFDVILGEAGNDDLRGQDGNDTLYGGAGFDKLNGGSGTDSCSVGENGGSMAACERRLA